jgi:glycosyltransferase involved in cell wall biosynthesis
MPDLPRISVVTSSYNQGRFLARTIESVLAQGYPDVEHIVVDGLSTDDTPTVLARYPHLRVIRERDRGQADAINKGFRLATGHIGCFLNSDDTLGPGALLRVAREIDPARGRHVVQGRCAYIDEDDRPTGEEHPSLACGHLRMLQVWKTHCVPQPATFWTREVWERCGPMDDSLHLALDYDLFCRFSRCYRFHFVDQVLANYRLHGDSKTCTNREDEVLARSVAISRRYWGPLWHPRRWLLGASLARHRFYRHFGPRNWVKGLMAAAHDPQTSRWLRGLCLGGVALLMPRVGLRRFLPRALLGLWDRALLHRCDTENLWGSGAWPQSLNWRGFTGRHADGAIGPVHRTRLTVRPGESLRVEAEGVVYPMPAWFRVRILVDGQELSCWPLDRKGRLRQVLPPGVIGSGEHEVELRASAFVVPHEWNGGEDYRPLSLVLRRCEPAAVGRPLAA